MTDDVQKLARLTCPKCGAGEQCISLHSVAVEEYSVRVWDGRLRMTHERTDAVPADRVDDRFICACGHEWPVPEWIRKLYD